MSICVIRSVSQMSICVSVIISVCGQVVLADRRSMNPPPHMTHYSICVLADTRRGQLVCELTEVSVFVLLCLS